MAANHVTIVDYSTIGDGAIEIIDGAPTFLFPQIDSVAKKGGRISWRVYVRLISENGTPLPLEEYIAGAATPLGAVGWIKVDSTTTLGNIKESAPTIVRAGKNIGKKNQTNVLQQALRDAFGLHTKQLKKAAAVPKVGKKLFFPMLAQILADQPNIWDGTTKYLSPKLDGLRGVFTWDVTIGALRSYSRTITLFPGPEVIHAELRGPLSQHPNLFLDGEFYADGIKLQDINSVVRRLTGSTQYDSLITYRVYDCFVANGDEITPEPFSQRLTRLNEFFAANPQLTRVRPVPQTPVTTEAEATALYTKYLAEGYEGAMIRLDTPYESRPNNYHSKTLLKMKPTLDAEFELIGWETAQKGRAADALMLVCVAVAPDGTRREFRVTPAMPLAERVELAARMPEEFDTKWRGKFITVQFASWSKDHVPQQPRTLMQTRVD